MLFNAFPNWLIRQIIVHKSHKYQANYACMLHCMCMYIWWHTSPAHGMGFLASLVFTSCCACLRSSQAFICCSIDSRSARQAVMIDFILRRMASRPQKSTKSREDRFEIMKNISIIRYRSYILNTPIIKLYTLNVALNLNIKLKHFIHKTPQSNFHNPQEWSDLLQPTHPHLPQSLSGLHHGGSGTWHEDHPIPPGNRKSCEGMLRGDELVLACMELKKKL